MATLTRADERKQAAIARTVEDITTFIATTADEWEEYHLYVDGHRLNPMRFNRAMPMIAPEILSDDRQQDWLFGDVAPGDLPHPIDIAFVGNLTSDDRTRVLGRQLHRVRQVTLAEVRGKVRHYSRWMVTWDNVVIPEVGTAEAMRAICGSIGPNEKIGASLTPGTFGVAGTSHVWLPNLMDGSMPPKQVTSEMTHIINSAYALAFTARYEWHVNVGYEGYPSVRIPTDERGVRALFADRDIAEGRDRRVALKHWVGEHWRRSRIDEGETETLVRRYLRGEVAFTWGGFACALEPSAFDLDKNEELRKARAAMRKEQARRPAKKGG
jgi:hypothetical protein